MAVTEIVARMYDARGQRPSSPSPSEKGFDEVISDAAKSSENDREVCVRCGGNAHALKPTLVSHKIDDVDSESAKVEATSSEEPVEPAQADISDIKVNSSAAYRFSIYIRTSSDIGSLGSSLAESFKEATLGFIQALHQDADSGINLFDSYLGQASAAAGSGSQQTSSFIDQMLEAADNGLKAVTASMNSASMFSGLNLSMNSALPGTSSADIAGIYLQDAMKNGSINSSGMPIVKSAGQGGLQLIRTEELLTTVPELNPQQQSSPLIKNKILDRFMQMLEGLGSLVSPQQTEVYYSLQFGQLGGASSAPADDSQVLEQMPEAADSTEEVSG